MIFQPRKSALYQLAIEHGISTPDELAKFLPLGSSVPKPRLEGWLRWLFKSPKAFSSRRRYVNRFRLGADPEFVLANVDYSLEGRPIAIGRIDASSLGLAQGPAFGADNNGRLAEIRPYPARSAVEVVASILCTLRWMATQVPNITKYEWLAGAYIAEDGVGGHVHFGRKRPNRKLEVEALDAVEEGLLHLGVYPKEQVLRRRQGDARRQIYGALGDYRLQQHGYEYRTFPSWLDSPEVAFLTLVVSKLAVQMPSLYRFQKQNPITEFARLRNFLAFFKGVDDDARLALLILDRGLPTPKLKSFAPRWGITTEALPKRPVRVSIVPPCIRPDAESINEVFAHLQTGGPLGFRVPEITWTPTAPPAGYEMCLPHTNTTQAKGLGEMIWDLCSSQKRPVCFLNAHRGSAALLFSKDLIKDFPANWRARFEQHADTLGESKSPGLVYIAPEWREGSRAVWTRNALLNGLLPVWRAKHCTADSLTRWQAQVKKNIPPSIRLVGKVLYESQAIPALN